MIIIINIISIIIISAACKRSLAQLASGAHSTERPSMGGAMTGRWTTQGAPIANAPMRQGTNKRRLQSALSEGRLQVPLLLLMLLL